MSSEQRIEVKNLELCDDAYAFRITTHKSTSWETSLLCETRGFFADIGGASKLYAINLNHVECIVGEWNKDKTEYGVRVFYASGNSVWIGKRAAKKLIKSMNTYEGSCVNEKQLDK